MKATDTLVFSNIITQNAILAKRAWFWHFPSYLTVLPNTPSTMNIIFYR